MAQDAPDIYRAPVLLAARLMLWAAIPLVSACAWANSHLVGDWVHYYDPARPLFVRFSSDRGVLSFSWRRVHALYEPGWDSSFRRGTYAGGGAPPGAVFGFHAHRNADGGRFGAPYWFLTAAAALPAAFAWRRRRCHLRSRRRAATGQCARCGYDLRATPARCPECGASRSGPPPAERAARSSGRRAGDSLTPGHSASHAQRPPRRRA